MHYNKKWALKVLDTFLDRLSPITLRIVEHILNYTTLYLTLLAVGMMWVIIAIGSVLRKRHRMPVIQKNITVTTREYSPPVSIPSKPKMVFDVKANYLGSGHINFSINSSRAKMPIWFYVYSEGLQYGMKGTSVSKPGEIDDDRLYVNVLDYGDRNCSLKEDSCPSQYDIDQFHLDGSGSYSKDIVLYSSIINKYKFSDMDTLWESSSMIDGRKAQNLSSKFIAEKEGKVYLSFTIPIYSYSGDEYQGGPLEPSQLPENCSNVKRGQEDWLICKQQVIIEVSEETKTQIKDIEATQKKIEESQPENAYFCAQTYVKQVIKFSKSIPDPDSAEFQMTDWDIQQENPGVYIVRSYFKAENIFGTVQRHYYSCKVKYPPSDGCRNQGAEYIECKDE